MKRILLTLMLCISLLACEPPTIEKKIELAFKQYVAENFNDPRDLKEIISILPNDTMTIESIGKIKYSLDELRSCISQYDSVCKRDMEILEKNLTPSVIRKYYGDNRVLSIIEEQMKVTNKRIDWYLANGNNYDYLRLQLDTCYNSIDSSLFKVTYEIKTRVNERGGLKLMYYYAIVDKENIDIYSSYPTFKDYSPQVGHFFDYMEEYQPLLEQLCEQSGEALTLSKKLLKALHIE